MTKGTFLKTTVVFTLLLSFGLAQENVDAIEKARQAKEAADRAAADAAAATEAAIEAAAAKAAEEARAEAKRKKEEEEARKIAEAQAAEEAELDAAAAAAAEEAKRKMAEELGLEYDDPDAVTDTSAVADSDTTTADDVVAKEALGYNVGLTGSIGFINGAFITNTPAGASLVITTPYGFKFQGFDFTVSVALGSYSGQANGKDFTPLAIGVGANLTLFDMLFYEGHVGLVGAGMGGRGFGGVSLEKILNKGLNLPVNILLGLEGFLSTSPLKDNDTASYWGGLGVRFDYSF